MDPAHQTQFGNGLSESFLSPPVLLLVLLAGLGILLLPRNKAIVPFLFTALLIPTDQVLLLGSFHFPVVRLLLVFGYLRLLKATVSGDKILSGGINGIDKAFLVLTFVIAIDGNLLWRAMGEFYFQLGEIYSAIGGYFLLRFFIRDDEDVRRALRTLACVAAIVAVVMVAEQATGTNYLYKVLGGARADIQVLERDGKLRATGSFAHPNLAGTFGGFMFPLFIGLWSRKEPIDRKYAIVGLLSSLTIPFATGSSTALFGFMGGILALCFWPLRRRMRIVRWIIALTLITLHMVMKAPVWHLISRVDLTGSSSSYHRFELLNNCIIHFWDWAFIGTRDYGTWGWDMWDLSNQYVLIADQAGLIPLIAFLIIVILAFRYVGNARKAYEKDGDGRMEFYMWTFGACTFANVVAFFGIGYFDQTVVAWYAVLSMILAVTMFSRSVPVESQSSPIFEPAEASLQVRFSTDTLQSHRST
jgi:hypothetical protein